MIKIIPDDLSGPYVITRICNHKGPYKKEEGGAKSQSRHVAKAEVGVRQP